MLRVLPLVAFAFIASSAAVAQSSIERTLPSGIEASLQALIDEAEVPGLSVAYLDGGDVAWDGAFGVANTETNAPVTPSTVFEAASLTKPFVAYLALRQAEAGALDLDAPLWDVLPYERLEHDERARQITARLALAHTPGLPNWGGTPLQLNAAPGERWGYSGEGYVYLQRVLEETTGLSLDALAHRDVFGPLGMEHSSLVWEPAYDSLSAVGHGLIGGTRQKNRPSEANGASSLHTTARDYGRFMAHLLSDEAADLLALARVETADVAAWGPEETYSYVFWGLGWGLQNGPRGTALWHWGDNGVFRAYAVLYPDSRDGLVYFANSTRGHRMAEQLVDLFFDDTAWALRWLDSGSYDDPGFQSRTRLARAFAEDGAEAGLRLYSSLRDASTLDERSFDRTMWVHSNRGQGDVVTAALAGIVREEPTAQRWRSLGDAQVEAGDYATALASYESAIALDDDLAENLAGAMAWLRDGIAAEAAPGTLSDAELRAFVGTYGPRMIRFEAGALIYAREGATSATRLRPLTETMFALESSTTFRLRFERDASGAGTHLTGLYADGRTDVSERSDGRAAPAE